MAAQAPTILLLVRGLKSTLSRDEMDRRMKERMPRFRSVPGLVQKYYSYDPETDEWAGVYLFDSEESLQAYRQSDLCQSIATAYELTGPPRLERFPLVDVLRP